MSFIRGVVDEVILADFEVADLRVDIFFLCGVRSGCYLLVTETLSLLPTLRHYLSSIHAFPFSLAHLPTTQINTCEENNSACGRCVIFQFIVSQFQAGVIVENGAAFLGCVVSEVIISQLALD